MIYDNIDEYIEQLEERYKSIEYGKITLEIQGGMPVRAVEEVSIKFENK